MSQLPQMPQMPPHTGMMPPTHRPPNSVKLFVGQVPKTLDEAALKPIFDEFGQVIEVAVIRDRTTGAHRGCCFVIYATRPEADACIASLHNKRILPPNLNALQCKFAQGEIERLDFKLFVGQLPRTMTEDALKELFSPYGSILEVAILRSPHNESKGCGFVRFSSREEADAAIAALNQTRLEGNPTPLIVKFADTEKEKSRKRMITSLQMHLLQAQQWGLLAPQLARLSIGSTLPPAPTGPSTFPPAAAAAAQGFPQMSLAQLAALAPMLQPASPVCGRPQPGFPAGIVPQLQQQQPQQQQRIAPSSPPQAPVQPGAFSAPLQPIRGAGATQEGPAGANCFIYHIPPEFTDNDLAAIFVPFGPLISAKIYTDKMTGLSRGFGFVSYELPESAQAAIANMNGFQIGNKRLKVQLKRPSASSGSISAAAAAAAAAAAGVVFQHPSAAQMQMQNVQAAAAAAAAGAMRQQQQQQQQQQQGMQQVMPGMQAGPQMMVNSFGYPIQQAQPFPTYN
ncbi:putative RNA-binding protein BRN1 [Paratrimastix pyriformis]|uniref:RNA-binding protein BRN1 n=1 Tax=Paratrimastix pyriformis TaxID=342808 RepID=A0ABQ8UYZ0_9EUKA|nr:putative RNA-binding protein BRN1 [Paratrimastix pyriformis]